jgi:hypothetical protein
MGINIPRTDYFSMDKNEERLMNSPRILMLEMEENIQGCLQCYRDCLRTFSRLLTLESDAELANPEQLHLLLVCDDVCRMCAEFYTPLFRISPACREPVLCRFAGDPSRFGTTCGHRPLSYASAPQHARGNSVGSPGTLRRSRVNYLMKHLRR